MSSFSPVWNPLSYGFGSLFVNGTNGHDSMLLNRHDTAIVDMKGGNDRLTLYGNGDYQVDLGAGSDRLYVNTGTATIDADGGAGSDWFSVDRLGNHKLDGGTGYDHLAFASHSSGIKVTMSEKGRGYVTEIDAEPDAPELEFISMEYIHGTRFDDLFYGSEFADRIYTFGGDNEVRSEGGDDFVVGAAGKDKAHLGDGNDAFYGKSGSDLAWGQQGNDRLYGQNGNDRLDGSFGDDYLSGGKGNDFLVAGHGSDKVYGGAGADRVYAVMYAQQVSDASNDFFSGGSNGSGDTVETSVDSLIYHFAKGSIHIDVDAGQATGYGAGIPVVSVNGPFTSTQNFIDTFTGFERYVGTNYDDTFRGSSDASIEEYFVGNWGKDVFYASAGDDHFTGGRSQAEHISFDVVDYSDLGGSVFANLSTGKARIVNTDTDQEFSHYFKRIDGLIGGDGRDRLVGNNSDNRLEGGQGADTLVGSGGADTFAFNGDDGDLSYDTIRDFGRGDDVLELENLHFVDGVAVTSFDVLDGNNDGIITSEDTHVFEAQGDLILLFENSIIALNNVTSLSADDLVFA